MALTDTPKAIVVLNTGGFSRQYADFLQRYYPHWVIDWLSVSALSGTSRALFSSASLVQNNVATQQGSGLLEKCDALVIVADHKFTEFKDSLPPNWQKKAVNYQDALQYWAKDSQHNKAFIETASSSNRHLVAIVLNENKGYRKAHYEVLKIIERLHWQPILLCRRMLKDSVEQRFPTCLVNDNFELAILLQQLPVDLLIADNDIPAETMQRLSMPKLYIPHGVVGLLERFVDMNADESHMFSLVDSTLMRCFTHIFVPTASVLSAFMALYDAVLPANKPEVQLISGGYLNLDLAIGHVDTTSVRDAILYCPSAIPQSDQYSQRIPVSFPNDSLAILQALLARFPLQQIIFRHHPSAIETPTFKAAIDAINNALRDEPRYIYDSNPTHKQAFAKAKLVISDASTSAYTFSLSHCLPTISFLPDFEEVPLMINQHAYTSSREQLGAVVIGDITELMQTVENVLNATGDVSDAIKRFRQQEYFNVGKVAKHLEQTLVSIVEKVD